MARATTDKNLIEQARQEGYKKGFKTGYDQGLAQGKLDAQHLKFMDWGKGYDSGYDAGYDAGKDKFDRRYKEGRTIGIVAGIGISIVALFLLAGFAALDKHIERRNMQAALREKTEQNARMLHKTAMCSDRWKGYVTRWDDRQQICSVRIWPNSDKFVPEDKIHVGADPWSK